MNEDNIADVQAELEGPGNHLIFYTTVWSAQGIDRIDHPAGRRPVLHWSDTAPSL